MFFVILFELQPEELYINIIMMNPLQEAVCNMLVMIR